MYANNFYWVCPVQYRITVLYTRYFWNRDQRAIIDSWHVTEDDTLVKEDIDSDAPATTTSTARPGTSPACRSKTLM